MEEKERIIYDLISKEKAKLINQKWYYTGIECKNGHVEKRYTNTGICYGCKRNINKRNQANNPETFKKRYKKAYAKLTKYQIRQQSINKRKKNPEKYRQIKRKWKLNNLTKVRENARLYEKEKRLSGKYRLSKAMSKGIWQSLKGSKTHSWVNLVDYDFNQLTNYLESKFNEYMNWDNYGKYWHIDHIRPLSWFDLPDEFLLAWRLENLQPLEASKNLSKNNRYEG